MPSPTPDTPRTQAQGRDALKDPQPGDVVGYREEPARTVTGRFVDACDTLYVIYTVEHRIPVKTWEKWARNATVYNAAK